MSELKELACVTCCLQESVRERFKSAINLCACVCVCVRVSCVRFACLSAYASVRAAKQASLVCERASACVAVHWRRCCCCCWCLCGGRVAQVQLLRGGRRACALAAAHSRPERHNCIVVAGARFHVARTRVGAFERRLGGFGAARSSPLGVRRMPRVTLHSGPVASRAARSTTEIGAQGMRRWTFDIDDNEDGRRRRRCRDGSR